MKRPRWRPLFTGIDAEVLSQRVASLASASHSATLNAIAEPGLALGTAGVCLLQAARVRAGDDDAASARGRLAELLEAVSDAIETRPLAPHLSSGLAGVASALHLVGVQVPSEARDLALVEETLLDYLDEPGFSAEFLHGLAGIGMFFSMRLGFSDRARTGVARVLELLWRSAVPEAAGGIRWDNPRIAALLDFSVHRNHEQMLGVAHGQGGIFGFVCMALNQPCSSLDTAASLYDGIVTSLQCSTQLTSTLATDCTWCWGDGGLGVVALHASRIRGPVFPERQLRSLFGTFGAVCTARSYPDACLCHGASGAAHLLHHAGLLLEDEELVSRARRLFWSLDSLRSSEGGVGGFATVSVDQRVRREYADPGFLFGASGIGLACQAAIDSTAPSWAPLLSFPSAHVYEI